MGIDMVVNRLADFRAWDSESGCLNVIIETPKASRSKFEYDSKEGLVDLGKVLPKGMSFPCDFGFVPSTRGEDGDPLDVLVVMDEPAFTGCRVRCRLIGVTEEEQTNRPGETVRNDRLVA
jgi:inorganic pyrophosphatase